MICLVGLGNTGTKIVEKLSEYPNYNIITIDSGKDIPECKTAEEYEVKCPSFKKKFQKLGEEIYLFVSASGKISGAALRILEQLKEYKTNVVCISSDPVTLPVMGKLQQNLVVGILQEYARSGLLNSLYILDNSQVEEFLPEVSIDKYWDEINNVISYIFHINMFFRNSEADFTMGEHKQNIDSIKTFGMIKNGEKKLLYNMKHITNERYYLSYDKDTEKNILKTAKKILSNNNLKVGVFLYKNASEDKNVYFESSTHILQNLKE